jgi:hypothetical protein
MMDAPIDEWSSFRGTSQSIFWIGVAGEGVGLSSRFSSISCKGGWAGFVRELGVSPVPPEPSLCWFEEVCLLALLARPRSTLDVWVAVIVGLDDEKDILGEGERGKERERDWCGRLRVSSWARPSVKASLAGSVIWVGVS